MKRVTISWITAVFCFLIVIISFSSTAHAQVEFNLADQITEALDLYVEAEFEKSMAIVNQLIQRNDLTAADSVAIYEVMSIITYAKGQEYRRKSFDYLDKISDIGPCVINFPRDLWPSELRDRWYKITQAKNMLVCPQEIDKSIRTIAIMEFDNHSLGKFQEELGSLSKGLADFFEYDFSQISGLKVVERDKIEFVLKELELQASGKVDESTAAEVGKILGAQLMVFGSITQLDNKSTRMIVRVVKVETSEIIASVSEEGKPDYIEMEKKLVTALAEKLDLMISDDAKSKIKAAGPETMDAAKLYAVGLDYMDKYDYENAYNYFKMAYEKDSSFDEAKRKMEIYKPLIG